MPQAPDGRAPVGMTTDDHHERTDDSTNPDARERQEALAAFWVAVKRLPAYTRMSAALVRDARVPYRARAVLMVGGAYLVSPIDLVPGLVPVAGQLDDMYIALAAIRQALRMSPPEVATDYLNRYRLDEHVINDDLGAIRRLVRVGVVQGAKWGRERLDRLGRQLGGMLARRKGA